MPSASAVHDTGAFQLDGNATTLNPPPGDDWDVVCHQVTGTDCSTSNNTNGASAVDWVSEPNLNSTIFTGGGSKDPQDISSWAWKDGAGGLPAKDNLLHSFAARYPNTNEGDVLFFGSDRYDNSGDAQQGFWFFQNSIGLGSNSLNGGSGFSGVHKNGDVLVTTDFSVGGTTSTISVYNWDSTCKKTANPLTVGKCADANLRLDATSTNAKCGSANPDTACGIVNASTITMPWSFTDKSGTPNNQALNGEFFEGGVDLTALGLGNKCFATVASESRSSTSTTATLQDFILGGFANCGSATTTQSSITGSTSIGTGSVPVNDSATVTVTDISPWTGNVQFSLRGPIGSPLEVDTTIGNPVAVSNTASTVQSPTAHVTAAGDYCWSASFTSTTAGVTNSNDNGLNECFTVTPVTPTLPTTAGPNVPLGTAVTDTAHLTGTSNQPGTPAINPTTAGAQAGGTIQFTLVKDDCKTLATGSGTNPQSVTVTGDNTYGPVSFTPDSAGTYHWIATYNPPTTDPNNVGSTFNGDCSQSAEQVVVSSTAVTSQSSVTGSVTILPGSVSGHDSATVVVSGVATWNGTVQFHLDGPKGSPLEVSTDIGNPVAVSSTTPTVQSDTATVTAAGQYCWSAKFTHITTGVPDAADNGLNECFTVTPVTPTLPTTAGPDVLLGNAVTDTAHLMGTSNQPGTPAINPTTAGAQAGGTIQFTLVKDDCITPATGTGTNPQSVTVTGDNTYGPVSFTPDSVGTYHWIATYTPAATDPNNVGSTFNGDCSQSSETVKVTSVNTSMTSAQSFIPNDSASVSAPLGGPLSGMVTFKLFESSDCSGNAIYTQMITVSGVTPQTVSTDNTTVSTTAANVSWLVSYDSNNLAQQSISAKCFEKTALGINNDGTVTSP
jgi:hypothetical protein